jgi:hypothetical protein
LDLPEGEFLVEGSRALIDWVDSDESSGNLGTCIRCTLDRLNQEITTHSLSLVVVHNGEAGQEHHPDLVVGQSSPMACGQRLPADSSHCECVVADDAVPVIEQHECPRQVASLVVEGMVAKPIVEGLYSAAEGAKVVLIPEALDAHSVDALQSTRSTSLGNELLRWMDGTVERLDEPLVVVLGEPDRPVLVDDGGGVRERPIEKELRYRDARQASGLGQQVVIVR